MWLEQKYIGLISNRLDRFKRIKNNAFNFRCPVCGDSQKSRTKARGNIFQIENGHFLYHCHNCNITMGMDKFIEFVDPLAYQEFVKEKISINVSPYDSARSMVPSAVLADKMKSPTFVKDTALKTIKKISQLKFDHPAKQYIDTRKIPTKYHSKLFYAPRFRQFVRSINTDLMQESEFDEPRLIIPFLDEEKNLFGLQGRSFKKDGIRYLTIMIDKSKPKIFGLDTCNRNKTHYIFEGPIDSMFVENSIAMAGGSINFDYVNEHSVFVYDNEPRSAETCAKISKVIDKGHSVVIFPEWVQSKDINDMYLKDGIVEIDKLLYDNISHGLEAKIYFTAWKKI